MIFDHYDSPQTEDNRPAVLQENENVINVKNTELLEAIRDIGRVMRDTNESLTAINDRLQAKDKTDEFKDAKAYEWYTVAVAFDRLFFFMYLSTVLIMAFVSSAILFGVLWF